MSSLRSSRGYTSVTLDRLRYGSGSGPGVLAVGIDGVVGPTGTANLQSLNVMGTATIDTAVINTVEIKSGTAVDFQTQTLEVSGTGTIGHLNVDTVTGSIGTFGYLSAGGFTGNTGAFGYLSAGGFTGNTGTFNDLTVNTVTGSTGAFGYLSAGGFTGNTGTFNDLTVNTLHVIKYIDNVDIVASIAADYIAGAKIRAGDENTTLAQNQYEALYVEGNAYITGPATAGTLYCSAVDTLGTSLSAVGNIRAANIYAVGTLRAKNKNTIPATLQLMSDIGGTGNVQWRYENSGSERTTMTVYPKPLGTTGIEVESTPLVAGIVGPVGIAGGIGDKYINRSMQVGGILYGTTGSFQNVTAGSLSTTGTIQGASLNVTGGATAGFFSTTGSIQGGSLNVTGGATAGFFGTTGLIQGGSLNVTGGATAGFFGTTGLIQGGSLNVTGGITGSSLSTTGTIQGASLNVTGGATAGSFSTIGSIQGGSLNVTGGATAGSFSTIGSIQGGSLNVTGGATAGSFGTTGLIQGGSLNVTGGATAGSFSTIGSIQGGSLNVSGDAEIYSIYTDKISPFPVGSTGTLTINGGALITNGNTDNIANAAEISFKTNQSSTERSAAFTCVGSTGVGYGGTSNDTEQFCLYTTPSIPNGNVRTKVESTPLKAGTTGPLGITGGIGDKYFYGSVQAGGTVYGNTGYFQNMTVNGLLTMNGTFVYGVQVI